MGLLESIRGHLRMQWLGWLLAAFSTCLSIYLFVAGQEKREPTFVVDPSRQLLLEGAKVSKAPIRIVRTDGVPVEGDVTSVTAWFWNEGATPIMASDVVSPLVVSVGGEAKILDFGILRATFHERSQAKVERVSGREDAIQLSFRMLDQRAGVKIRMLVEGTEDPPVTISGILVGATHIDDNEDLARRNFWSRLGGGLLIGLKWVAYYFVGIFAFFLLLYVACELYTKMRKKPPPEVPTLPPYLNPESWLPPGLAGWPAVIMTVGVATFLLFEYALDNSSALDSIPPGLR